MSSRAMTSAATQTTQSDQRMQCSSCHDGEFTSHLVQEHDRCACVMFAAEFAGVPDSTCPKCRAELAPDDLSTVGVLYVCDGCGIRTDRFPGQQE